MHIFPSRPADEVPPALAAWAREADASRLTDRTVRDAQYYLERYRWLTSPLKEEAAFRLVARIRAEVSPPPPIGIAPLDIIATALAMRRDQSGGMSVP